MFEHRLHSQVEIAASADRVWTILTNFGAYPDWNPFIRQIRGTPEPGARLEVRIQPSGTRGMTFRPVVLTAERPTELRWLGRLLLPGIFDGEHAFRIGPLPGVGVLFEQSERFSGVLVPVLRSGLDRDTKRGFEAMNAALKARAEGGGASLE